MLSDETLATLTARSRRFGNRVAIHCGDVSLSYVELDDRVARLARVLRDRGTGPGKVVSLYGPVGWQWVAAYHAILRAGAIVNPVNALLTPDEVGYILRDCNAGLILADDGRLRALRGAGALTEGLPAIDFADIDALSGEGASLDPDAAGDPGALSTLCYTSGTTGRPKGAMLSHRNVQMNAALTGLMHGRTSDDVTVSALPLAHVYGNVVMNGSLLAGGKLVLIPDFSPEAVIEAVAAHAATRFEGVPTMYYRLLDAPTLATANVASLRLCTVGGQTMPVAKMEAVEKRLDCPLIELWGMSEIGGLGTSFPWTGPHRLGSIGIALPGMQVRTVDPETRIPSTEDTPGELQVRGITVMLGYLGNEAATRETLDSEGWLSTGDIARIDALGHVFIIDRMKDVILTSGNNVYPAEVERAIASLAGVAMVGVGRDSHPDKGEVPHAYIVCERGVTLCEEEVVAHCRGLLAPYKLPRRVSFVADLPRNSSGKILRRLLGDTE